jgi:hypothetical protein
MANDGEGKPDLRKDVAVLTMFRVEVKNAIGQKRMHTTMKPTLD